MDSGTVLVVASSVDGPWAQLIAVLRDHRGYRVLGARSASEAVRVLGNVAVDLVIADHGIAPSGCALLAELRLSHPDVARVLVFDGVPPDLARAAVYQYLHLPLDPQQACLVIERGLEAREVARRHRRLARELKLSEPGAAGAARTPPRPAPVLSHQQFGGVVYTSDAMSELCHQARLAARSDLPIWIQGEPGTGKQLLARAIHEASPRNDRPLWIQRCTGVPDGVLHVELFGAHGAPATALGTGVLRPGVLRQAHTATVFLDDIAEVSPAFQASLLRFLQDGDPAVRVLAGSSRPLKQLVTSGRLRRDLYHRLKGFELDVPALRDRAEDVAPIAALMVRRHAAALGRRVLGLSARALDRLTAYGWPGNVRELELELRRLVAITGDGEYITEPQLSPELRAAPRRTATPWLAPGKTLKDHVESLEKHIVHETLERCQWNQSKAADELGLSRVGLANKIRRYRLAD
jgi:two-component system response regulator HupR/HoxA